jgi:hypothetical protein
MEIDVIYRISQELCWKVIKGKIKPQSISMILYRACSDIYNTKKIIWNSLSRLKEDGVFCIECCPKIVSNIINIIDETGYEYSMSCFGDDFEFKLYVFVYGSEFNKLKCKKMIRIKDWKDIVYNLLDFTKTKEIILLISNEILPFLSIIKQMNRYVIAFGDNDFIINSAKKQGIREVKNGMLYL